MQVPTILYPHIYVYIHPTILEIRIKLIFSTTESI